MSSTLYDLITTFIELFHLILQPLPKCYLASLGAINFATSWAPGESNGVAPQAYPNETSPYWVPPNVEMLPYSGPLGVQRSAATRGSE